MEQIVGRGVDEKLVFACVFGVFFVFVGRGVDEKLVFACVFGVFFVFVGRGVDVLLFLLVFACFAVCRSGCG